MSREDETGADVGDETGNEGESAGDLAVGICSAAHVHTDAYAGILADMDGVNLVGVADEDAERGRDAATRHDTDYLATDDLVDAVDAAVICSTNADHRDWVQTCADAEVDVLCEKPLAPTLAEAEEIAEIVEESGIALGVAMPLRFSEPARRAAETLESGRLGAIRSISGTNRGQMPGGWFADPEESGGGAVMDHTVHIVDLVYHLTSEAPAEVYCLSGTRFHDVPVEDVNVLSMELTDGTQFLLDGSWSRPDEYPTWGDATLELTCADGTVAVDCFDQTLRHTADSGDQQGVNSVFWGSDPNAGLIRDFVDAVRDGRDPEITAEDALVAVATVEAAYESHERGEPVQVNR